jgi:hypothetical protein
VKKYQPLTPGRGEGGQNTYEGITIIDGHPYGVFRSRSTTPRGQWYDVLELTPFVEIVEDWTNGSDEPLPDGNGHPDHSRKQK